MLGMSEEENYGMKNSVEVWQVVIFKVGDDVRQVYIVYKLFYI